MKKIKKVVSHVWCLLFFGIVCLQFSASLFGENKPYFEEEWLIAGSSSMTNVSAKITGREFAVKSEYLNIGLTSSETISCILESVPKIVSFIVESKSSANLTTITLKGLEANKVYYRYQDGEFLESFTTDSNGEYSYVQDISREHLYFRRKINYLYPS